MLCAIDGQADTLDEEDDDPPVRAIVAAAGRDPPETRALRSVFELGQALPSGLRLSAGLSRRRRLSTTMTDPAARICQALRHEGTTRCIGAAYPSRWTPEDEERERRRRAKQCPPRPTRRAKTKSKKLRELALIWDE